MQGVEERRFGDDGRIPNNPELPLLLYGGAVAGWGAARCREVLAGNGWVGSWVDGVFPYHHYHSNAHEVLCVVGGEARLRFGGPEGETVGVRAGDVVVIPAGVGHRNEGSSEDFSVVGAYPRGQERYDLRTGEEGERPEVLENIRRVPPPETDPIYGGDGPLVGAWDVRGG